MSIESRLNQRNRICDGKASGQSTLVHDFRAAATSRNNVAKHVPLTIRPRLVSDRDTDEQ